MVNPKLLKNLLRELGDDVLSTSVLAVKEAGDKIIDRTIYSNEVRKTDKYAAHHAILERADLVSQETILHKLNERYPAAYFMAEEEVSGGRMAERRLTQDNYSLHLNEFIFGIDPLDGTSQHNRGLYEWAVSIGSMKARTHTTGAIYAPEVKNGLVVLGAQAKGVYILEGNTEPRMAQVAEDRELKDTTVHVGVDVALDSRYNSFVNELANRSRTTSVTGSCALGLALVASGKIDALIQPTQRVWDWFGGYPLVEEAGGMVGFYRFENGKVLPVEKPEPRDYDPESRNLGFIAANKKLADRLMGQLVRQY